MAEKDGHSLSVWWYSDYIAIPISQIMGRTVPSYRIATEMERNKWKIFRQRLDKKTTEISFITRYAHFLVVKFV